MLFRGTKHHPLITFEREHEARSQAGQQLRLWHEELINHERQSLDASRTVETLVLPRSSDLPRLPPQAAPNGWDYWGRPWVYLDAPSSHSEVGVSSALTPPSRRVTVAVLVDCPSEPQFLPDMVVAQSASIVACRATCQVWRFTQKGEIQDNLKLEVAANGCSLGAMVMAIVQLFWINLRLGRPFVCSIWGDERITLCLLGTLLQLDVLGPSIMASIMARLARLSQGIQL